MDKKNTYIQSATPDHSDFKNQAINHLIICREEKKQRPNEICKAQMDVLRWQIFDMSHSRHFSVGWNDLNDLKFILTFSASVKKQVSSDNLLW